MAMYLKITNGTTTLDLLGGSATNSFNLLADEWGPTVARRSERSLGGDVYETAVEQIPLYVQSDTDAATVLANIEALAALIDQAQVWRDGGDVAAVRIQYSPNSDTDYLECVILGPPDGEPGVVLPPNFTSDLWQNAVDGVVLQFERRGLWLGEAETQDDLTNTTDAVVALTFADSLANPSPVSVEVISDDVGSSHTGLVGFLAVSDLDDGINVASTYGSGSAGSTVSSVRSFGGDCREITPSSVTTYTVNLDLDGGAITLNPLRPELFDIFLVGRNLSDTVTYQVTAQLIGSVSTLTGDLGKARTIPTGGSGFSDQSAFVLRLGTLGCASSLSRIQLKLVPSETDTDTLQIDYAIACKLGTQLIEFPRVTELSAVKTLRVIQGQLDGDGVGTGTATTSQVQARAESVYYSDSAVRFPTAYGNKSLWMQGDTVQVCLFGWAAGRTISSTAYSNVTDFLISRSITAGRRPGYLVPR